MNVPVLILGMCVAAHAAEVLIIGDSMGEFANGVEDNNPEYLSTYCDGKSVVNKAIGGTTTSAWNEAAISEAVNAAGTGVKYVWVSIGGNDFQESGCTISEADLQQRLATMLSTVRKSVGATVNIVTTGYCQVWQPEDPTSACGQPAAFAVMMRAMSAATLGVGGTFVDATEFCGGSNTKFSPPTYFRDGIHLSGKGYCHFFSKQPVQAAFDCNTQRTYDCAAVTGAAREDDEDADEREAVSTRPAQFTAKCRDSDTKMRASFRMDCAEIKAPNEVCPDGCCQDKQWGPSARNGCPVSCNSCPATTAPTAPIMLATCSECTAAGRSWQIGRCNPSSQCMVADVGCFKTAASCSEWEEQQEAKELCPKQKNCGVCVSTDSKCKWNKADKRCFMAADYWGPPEDMASTVGECSAMQQTGKKNILYDCFCGSTLKFDGSKLYEGRACGTLIAELVADDAADAETCQEVKEELGMEVAEIATAHCCGSAAVPGTPCKAQVGQCPVAKCAAPPSANCKAVVQLVVTAEGNCCPKLCNFKAPDGSECSAGTDILPPAPVAVQEGEPSRVTLSTPTPVRPVSTPATTSTGVAAVADIVVITVAAAAALLVEL